MSHICPLHCLVASLKSKREQAKLMLVTLKNKIQPSEFENLIGFLKQVMNPAASPLASRELLQGVAQNGRFL